MSQSHPQTRAFEQRLSQMQLTLSDLNHSLHLSEQSPRVVLHWDEKLSDHNALVKQRNHVTIYGYHEVLVGEDCELVLDGPITEQTHLYIARLQLGANAKVRLQTDSWLFIEQLIVDAADKPAAILLKPQTGQRGSDGVNAIGGNSGSIEGQMGGDGGGGSHGTHGSNGGASRKAYVKIEHLDGHLLCIASAADGGDGGNGGCGGLGGNAIKAKSGNGGNGGNGGHGGHASNGSELFVTIDHMGNNAKPEAKSGTKPSTATACTPIPRGGRGGLSGNGGCNGRGQPDGLYGLDGTPGSDGADGQPASVHLRKP
jgi:hypothetical protein